MTFLRLVRQSWLALLLGSLLGCTRTQPSQTVSKDAGQARPDLQAAPDAGSVAATWSQASPDVLIYSAALAMGDGDRRSARTVLEAAMKRLGVQLALQPAFGLRDPLAHTPGDAEVVRDIAASGSHLAVGHRRLLSVVELSGRYRTLRLAEHAATIRDVVLSANGHRVATLDEQHVVRLFALPTGSLLAELPLLIGAQDFSCSPSCISFSPDSRWLLLADCGAGHREGEKSCTLHRLRSIDASNGSVRGTLQEQADLQSYTSRSDGNLMVMRRGERPRFFDLATALEWPQAAPPDEKEQRPRSCLAPPRESGERSWAVSPDRRILATMEASRTLCIWDLVGRSLKQALSLRPLGDKLRLHSLLADGRGLLVAQSDRALLLLNGEDTAPRAVLPAGLTTFPLDDGGARLLPRRRPRRGPLMAQRIELTAGGPRASSCSLLAPGASAQAAQLELGNVSGDGKYVFAVRPEARSASAQLIELTGSARLLPIPGQLSPRCCTQADFLDLNRRLVYADPDGSLRVHSIPDGALLHATPMLTSITSLRYQSAEALEADLSDGRSVQLWTSAGRVSLSRAGAALPRAGLAPALDALRKEAESRYFPDGAGSWTVSPDQRFLLLAGAHGVLLWIDAKSGALALRMQLVLPATQAAPGAVALSPAGRFELLGSVEDPDQYLICRAGPYAVPSALCEDWLGQSGMVASTLRTVP